MPSTERRVANAASAFIKANDSVSTVIESSRLTIRLSGRGTAPHTGQFIVHGSSNRSLAVKEDPSSARTTIESGMTLLVTHESGRDGGGWRQKNQIFPTTRRPHGDEGSPWRRAFMSE